MVLSFISANGGETMNKVVVFDLGGTLMEFVGMPPSWVDYYHTGFENVNNKYGLGISEKQIETAAQILTEYNPRVNYRENEIPAEELFEKAVASWNCNIPVDNIIEAFFEGIKLNTVIYDYSFDLIEKYKRDGYSVACLTDIPSGMPDDYFKKCVLPLIEKIDLYVSSQNCGYRKPNPYGLNYIAKHYGVNVNELLFIGDEEKDRLTAERAKCNFCFIKDIV